jgi:hypothetical protein
MRKKLRIGTNLLTLGACVALLGACNTLGGAKEEPSFWKRNFNAKLHVMKRDFTKMYQTWDRHMWNYDWDDPNID